mmetsp:Transcript_23858/g.60327  ORF Transcript_23858/g.60327 Transcript_23858/m.60327 type:complete len:205 (-) Transcript_23858:263-877(-)
MFSSSELLPSRTATAAAFLLPVLSRTTVSAPRPKVAGLTELNFSWRSCLILSISTFRLSLECNPAVAPELIRLDTVRLSPFPVTARTHGGRSLCRSWALSSPLEGAPSTPPLPLLRLERRGTSTSDPDVLEARVRAPSSSESESCRRRFKGSPSDSESDRVLSRLSLLLLLSKTARTGCEGGRVLSEVRSLLICSNSPVPLGSA